MYKCNNMFYISRQNYVVVKNQNYQLLCTNCFSKCQLRIDFLWLNKISNILNECGMSNIWNTQTCLNSTWLINTVKLKLRDEFEQTWHSLIDDSPKVNNYKLFKTSFQMEDYFELLEHKKSHRFLQI